MKNKKRITWLEHEQDAIFDILSKRIDNIESLVQRIEELEAVVKRLKDAESDNWAQKAMQREFRGENVWEIDKAPVDIKIVKAGK